MLKSQDKITAKPVTMCYMSGSIQLNNIYIPEHDGGIWQWLLGKSVTSIVFSNTDLDDGFVGISAPSPARILPIDLSNFCGEMLCQLDAFLCSLNDVVISSTVDQRAQNMASGAEVVLKQKLVGQGLAFLVGCGSVVQKILDVGKVAVVDTADIVEMMPTINFQVKYSHPLRRNVFCVRNNQTKKLKFDPGDWRRSAENPEPRFQALIPALQRQISRQQTNLFLIPALLASDPALRARDPALWRRDVRMKALQRPC